MPLWRPEAAGPLVRGGRDRVRVWRRFASVIIGSAVALMVLAVMAQPAAAHPLGNATVNRYARVEVSAGVVRVYYVLDLAELAAFGLRGKVASDRDGFTRQAVEEIIAGLDLIVDGRTLRLRTLERTLDQPAGQGGLSTLRVAAVLEATLPPGGADQQHELEFSDRNEPDRPGWREIVAVARGDARLLTSSAPNRDLSDELREYPGNLLQAPLDLRSVRLSFTPGSQAVDALAAPRSAPPPERPGGQLAELITRDNVNFGVLSGMLGVAFLVGAGHALLPGHGKTVMGAYLVGTKGRPIDAVLLGVIVSLMHTASVLVLGLVLYNVNRSIALERVYPALTVASGVLATAFGVWLLFTRLRHLRTVRSRARALDHSHTHTHEAHDRPADHGDGAGPHDSTSDHGHDAHAHDHDALHHHGPGGHTHDLPEDVAPLSRRGLVVLATSGGIVPSPTAVVVVVSAFSLGRAALGLTLIAAFSIGLAATLTGVGLSLVFGRSLFERRWPNRSLRLLPVVGAGALIVLGVVLVTQGALDL